MKAMPRRRSGMYRVVVVLRARGLSLACGALTSVQPEEGAQVLHLQSINSRRPSSSATSLRSPHPLLLFLHFSYCHHVWPAVSPPCPLHNALSPTSAHRGTMHQQHTRCTQLFRPLKSHFFWAAKPGVSVSVPLTQRGALLMPRQPPWTHLNTTTMEHRTNAELRFVYWLHISGGILG